MNSPTNNQSDNTNPLPKKSFLYRNRNGLSVLTVLVAFIAMYLDYKFHNIPSSPFQWFVLIIAVVFIIYLKFYITIDDEEIIDITDGHWRKDGPNTVDLITAINNNKTPTYMNTEDQTPTEQNEAQSENENNVPEISPEAETPAQVETPDQPEVSPEVAPEPENQKSPYVAAAKPIEGAIKTYSSHGVVQKFRPMFEDIHSFAVSFPKTEAQLNSKLLTYGHPFTTLKNGDNLVAFNFGFMRMPMEGWFGVKVD